jgi:heterodisulfide reductase subunit A-like polyferredoxin
MAIARAALLEPQHTVDVPVAKTALVVGGGVGGMTAALSLAEQGFPVHLIEKQSELGGNLRHVYTTTDSDKQPQAMLGQLVSQVQAHPGISVHLESTVANSSGFMGNFKSTIRSANGSQTDVSHGATILATGAQEYRGPEYGYGTDARIVTQQEFEEALSEGNDIPDSVVMIQCVGPAEQFCSRICCTVALKNALALKARKPEAEITILFRDIRTYGFKERLYTEAREKGVIFVRYDDEHRPEVSANGTLNVQAWDPILQQALALEPEMVVLSMPAVPHDDANDLAALFKVPIDADGFFLEAHVKLRPVDFSSDGVFMAGMAHYPKLLDETMIQAQAAAARAARVLSQETLKAGGQVAVVDEALCTGCLTCVRVCPFGVPLIKPDLTGVGNIAGAAFIEAAVCQGCGSCAAECPAAAIQLMHYTDAQMAAKVRALASPPSGFVPLENVSVPEGETQ